MRGRAVDHRLVKLDGILPQRKDVVREDYDLVPAHLQWCCVTLIKIKSNSNIFGEFPSRPCPAVVCIWYWNTCELQYSSNPCQNFPVSNECQMGCKCTSYTWRACHVCRSYLHMIELHKNSAEYCLWVLFRTKYHTTYTNPASKNGFKH